MREGAFSRPMDRKRVAETLMNAICARDLAALGAILAPDADMRALLPGSVREYRSAHEIVTAFEQWFGGATDFSIDPLPVEAVGSRFSLGWRVRLAVEGAGTRVAAQAAVVDVEDDRVYGLDLLCSGFEDVTPAAVAGSAAQHFDAGDLGCADGLAGEFRRRMDALPPGGVLRVTTRDPAAKEDLPPLARLLGHRVLGVEARPDGKTLISVERRNP